MGVRPMKSEAEIKWSQDKEPPRTAGSHQKLGDRHQTNSPPEPQDEPSQPGCHLDLGLLASITVTEHIALILRHPV